MPQQSSLQTRPLAATLATANTGLLNRSDPKHAHPASASKSKAQRRCSVALPEWVTSLLLQACFALLIPLSP